MLVEYIPWCLLSLCPLKLIFSYHSGRGFSYILSSGPGGKSLIQGTKIQAEIKRYISSTKTKQGKHTRKKMKWQK